VNHHITEGSPQCPLRRVEGASAGLAVSFTACSTSPNGRRRRPLKLRLLEAATPRLPDNTRRVLLGVTLACIISHGPSSATAIVNAVRRRA